jgi:ribosomal protein S16
MPAVIRLKRMGTLKKPVHRILVMDKRSARDGKPIEIIGL